jgi:phosphoribosylanthranilate isomerase
MAPVSSRLRVKICGITRKEDANVAVEAGAHALGFVFYPPSPRYIHPETAASIIGELPPFVNAVGVFVNLGKEAIEETASISGIHTIQLHGSEPPEDCTGYTRPVIKAFRFGPDEPLPDLQLYRVAGFLVDTGVPGKWGGTGVPLDWHMLRQSLDKGPANIPSRLILAGGLDPHNVAQAIEVVRPFAVDVSSGVEVAPGKKNATKIKEFMYATQITG